MPYPAALSVTARPAPIPGAPTIVFVHGSLDRAESFRRVTRRLPDLTTVAYDRRGYQGSRGGGVVDLGGHIQDLLDVAEAIREETPDPERRPLVAVGHSFGGDVVVGAALASPRTFDAIGAYEPPMPWLGFRRMPAGDGPGPNAAAPPSGRWPPLSDDPGEEVERFFSRMVSPESWSRLTDAGRAERRADGPALLAEMRSLRSEGSPFDVTELSIPAVFGVGGPGSAEHHRRSVAWLGANVSGAELFTVEHAQHGAHLSHPDHFAALARRVVELASEPGR
jgi:pimeloyl-ACP methyl ester carboxylesterase